MNDRYLLLAHCRLAVDNPGLHARFVVSTGGAVITPYNGRSYFDDLAYAAAWLHRLTGDGAYLASARSYYDSHVNVRQGPQASAGAGLAIGVG